MSRKIKLLVGTGTFLVVAAVALGGLLTSGTVLAQTPNGQGGLVQSFLGKLAANLNISQDALTKALKTTETQVVDEAQQQGKISQQTADNLKKRIDNNSNGLGLLQIHPPKLGPVQQRALQIELERLAVRNAISDTAQFLGVTVQQVQSQLQSGETLAQIARAKGKTDQDLINTLVNDDKGRVQAQVPSKLTQAQADQIVQRLPDLITKIVNTQHPAARIVGNPLLMRIERQVLTDAAQILKLTPQQLRQQMRTGKSLADIATAQNTTPQQLIDALVTQEGGRIDQLVQSGKLTKAQGDNLKSQLPTAIANIVNRKPKQVGPPKAPGQGQSQAGPRGRPFRGAV